MGGDPRSPQYLRPYNLAAAVLHGAQAVAVVVLANRFALPVRATYMTGPPGPDVGTLTVTLFSIRFAWAVAAFFALSAVAHLVVAVTLSLLAKSQLACQIFASTLASAAAH
jgi:hypothetical protein